MSHPNQPDVRRNDRLCNRRLSRRELLVSGLSVLATANTNAQAPKESAVGFGFGTYGMKSIDADDAISVIAEIGYDAVELCLLPGWLTEPSKLSRETRRSMESQLVDLRLRCPSLLESLPCLKGKTSHQKNLGKLRRATELAHHIAPRRVPVVQSIVGSKPHRWNEHKQQLVDELGDWARIGEETQTTVCFKPHSGHIIDDIDKTRWVHRQVGSPWLKTVYDYSHFFLAGMSLEKSLQELLPISAYIQIKDSRGKPGAHEYLLPGDGQTDYGQLFRLLRESDYTGCVGVEVSSMIHRQSGYQPIATARRCYQTIAPIMDRVGLARQKRAKGE